MGRHELDAAPADVIVFPEGTEWRTFVEAGRSWPDAAIVGAIVEKGQCRGVLLHQGRQRIDYLKFGTDGRTQGAGILPPTPVYEYGDRCIGVLICMDIQ